MTSNLRPGKNRHKKSNQRGWKAAKGERNMNIDLFDFSSKMDNAVNTFTSR